MDSGSCARGARVLIMTPHTSCFALGRGALEGRGHSWVPVVFTDRWDESSNAGQSAAVISPYF